MKKRNLTVIVLVLCLALNFSVTALASEAPQPQQAASEGDISPRFRYVMTASLGLKVSSSGAAYTVTINGISSVTRITGTVSLYKGSSFVDSTSINEYSSSVNTSGTLKTSGSGDYKLTFNGTVYTDNGSEPLSLQITDSY